MCRHIEDAVILGVFTYHAPKNNNCEVRCTYCVHVVSQKAVIELDTGKVKDRVVRLGLRMS